METIKVFQRTGYIIHHKVIKGIINNNCDFAVFQSESDVEGLDRVNIVGNFLKAATYRDKKTYSIIMDDDVELTSGAIHILLKGLKGHHVATLPVNNKITRVQHTILAIKNHVLDKYKIQVFNLNFCNQCVYIAHLIDKYNIRVNAMAGPMQKTINRTILKKGLRNE